MKRSLTLILLLLSIFGLMACAGGPQAAPKQELQKIRLGLGYIPNVQFAPFYVAQKKGFYAEEGLEVEIEYGFEDDFVALTAQGEREFAVASGDQVLLAQAQGVPIIYVMRWYQRYPVALVVPKSEGVATFQDLAGKKVGIPGLFGGSFVAWKAMLHETGLDESSVTLEEIGFTQVAALQQGSIDAAMVFIANEPVQLRNQGIEVDLFEVSDYVNMISNGLVVGEKLLQENPELVGKMVRASLKGLDHTIKNPEEAFGIVREVVPEMTDEDAPVQRQVLDVSIELWKSDSLGVTSQEDWQATMDVMTETGLLEEPVEIEKVYTNQFVEGE